MKLSDEQIQDLLRVGNPTDEECRLIRMGWDAAMAEIRAQPVGWIDAGDLRALVSAVYDRRRVRKAPAAR